MKKLFLVLSLMVSICSLSFAKDPCEGYWVSYDEKTNEITAAWNFYINKNGGMEATIVYSPGCDATTIPDACNNMKPVQNFPAAWKPGTMKLLYETPWIFGLKKVSDGCWDNGIIIDPSEGKKYNCKITFQAADGNKIKSDILVMRGSIGPVGRSQMWRRPDKETISQLKIKAKGITDFIDMVENQK